MYYRISSKMDDIEGKSNALHDLLLMYPSIFTGYFDRF
jgi:hypothetical protein